MLEVAWRERKKELSVISIAFKTLIHKHDLSRFLIFPCIY